MIIRVARPGDAEHIVAIWNPLICETATTFTTVEKIKDLIVADIAAKQDQNKAFLVVEQSDEILGFATYSQFRGGPGYAQTMEHTILLAPASQAKGIGRALISALEDQARATGVHSMIAGVSYENQSAIAFHQRLGYRQVAKIPDAGFKFDRWMDLILLQKIL